MQAHTALGQVFLHENEGFPSILGFILLMLRHLLLVLEESEVTSLVLHFSRNALGALVLLLRQLAEKVAYILLNHTIEVEIEAQREKAHSATDTLHEIISKVGLGDERMPVLSMRMPLDPINR
ncbi:hypothetical protein MJG53_008714 [Ovis ammon polii x Ovis aries]|uniref:Uncharacterized protein n=2 Tax=Ovis TaxID=9935 RepID=A0A836AF45_SHEEP|nr:hypothetical protein JEQ12_018517 [Ovis aries]KAI4583501.1 hypothetical protein MJG53_008714 [Ovis ammon polii x Ovis aries]